ncbi:hypothetical protein A6X21_09565 [Planctopirus hydrillae]|uniref:Uncharacterized protein n=1 Tax=Planctopirus hydrillae TaxID=1841610 RepID=A0A1C3E7H1_9PLAN|nr:hypothetical protein A6X21_09565 [Planctopirus hydrillae]
MTAVRPHDEAQLDLRKTASDRPLLDGDHHHQAGDFLRKYPFSLQKSRCQLLTVRDAGGVAPKGVRAVRAENEMLSAR